METPQLLQIKLVGPEIAPEHISAKDLAGILESVEKMLTELVTRANPHFKKEAFHIGLVNIAAGSVALQFASPLPTALFAASAELGTALQQQHYNTLPSAVITELQKLSAFTNRHTCNIEWYLQNGQRTHLATLTPEMRIESHAPLVGETILYGLVMRVGGKEPRVMFEPLDSSRVIYGDVSREVAQVLAKRLYQVVAIRCTCSWDVETLELLPDFKLEELLEYEPLPLDTAINGLAAQIGAYFTDIVDVEAHIAQLRESEVEWL